MKKVVTVVQFEELTDLEKDSVSNNGCGKEYASYLIIEDENGRRVYSDAMEAEDATFNRDLSWIRDELTKLNK